MQVIWDDQTIRAEVARAFSLSVDDVCCMRSQAVNGALCAVFSRLASHDEFRVFVPLREFAESVLGRRVETAFDDYYSRAAIIEPEN